MKDYQRRAKNKYKSKIVRIHIELYPSEEDIRKRLAERVENGEPRATYIKRLIREDMFREKTQRFIASEYGLPLELLK